MEDRVNRNCLVVLRGIFGLVIWVFRMFVFFFVVGIMLVKIFWRKKNKNCESIGFFIK